MLNVLAKFTHECLAIRVARRLKAIDATSATCARLTTASRMRRMCSCPRRSSMGAPTYRPQRSEPGFRRLLKVAERRERGLYGETDAEAIGRVLKSYRDFVELCERKEAETGVPCLIIASY